MIDEGKGDHDEKFDLGLQGKTDYKIHANLFIFILISIFKFPIFGII